MEVRNMKIAVRYYTKTGNTKRLAEAVAKAVGVEALPISTPITEPVDVLFLGSSHVFETYNTSVLWDEYGIASYVLGGSVQPMWNTYFYMKEALKTQTPELIVLDAYCCEYREEYNDYSRQIKNCYGMKPSLNKLFFSVGHFVSIVGFKCPLSESLTNLGSNQRLSYPFAAPPKTKDRIFAASRKVQ